MSTVAGSKSVRVRVDATTTGGNGKNGSMQNEYCFKQRLWMQCVRACVAYAIFMIQQNYLRRLASSMPCRSLNCSAPILMRNGICKLAAIASGSPQSLSVFAGQIEMEMGVIEGAAREYWKWISPAKVQQAYPINGHYKLYEPELNIVLGDRKRVFSTLSRCLLFLYYSRWFYSNFASKCTLPALESERTLPALVSTCTSSHLHSNTATNGLNLIHTYLFIYRVHSRTGREVKYLRTPSAGSLSIRPI